MDAIRVHEHGAASVLKLDHIPIPEPSPTQVLVKLHVAGVNMIDTYVRSGLYAAKLPVILGQGMYATIVKRHAHASIILTVSFNFFCTNNYKSKTVLVKSLK